MVVNQGRKNVVMNFSKGTSISILIIIFFPVFFLISCTHLELTKPNIPFAGNTYPTVLNELANTNSLLADELGKLPELQDGVSPSEETALKKMFEIYNDNQQAFNKAFEEMYKVGKPEIRKYCSPLQALFWLAQDDMLNMGIYNLVIIVKSKMSGNFVHIPFSIDALIDITWRGQRYLMVEANKSSKWDDFYTVADRLSAPELIDKYINKNIVFNVYPGSGEQSPIGTFNRKRGSCTSLSVFGKYMLDRAGYQTRIRSVNFPNNLKPILGHSGLVIITKDNRYILAVNFRPATRGRIDFNTMSGPHMDISQVDDQLASNKKITRSYWGIPDYLR